MNFRPWLILFVLMTTSLSGCFGEQNVEESEDSALYDVYPEPWERSQMQYDDSDIYSRVSVNGSYAIDAVQSVFVPVPTITAADGGSGITGNAEVHLGPVSYTHLTLPTILLV